VASDGQRMCTTSSGKPLTEPEALTSIHDASEDGATAGEAGSRSATWMGGQAHCQTLMLGWRENRIGPRLPSTVTRGQDPAMQARSVPATSPSRGTPVAQPERQS
jgi:hypothetical protein